MNSLGRKKEGNMSNTREKSTRELYCRKTNKTIFTHTMMTKLIYYIILFFYFVRVQLFFCLISGVRVNCNMENILMAFVRSLVHRPACTKQLTRTRSAEPSEKARFVYAYRIAFAPHLPNITQDLHCFAFTPKKQPAKLSVHCGAADFTRYTKTSLLSSTHKIYNTTA